MILKFGGFAFPLGTTEVTITRKDVKSESQQEWAEEVRWNIRYHIQNQAATNSAAMAAIRTKLVQLENAFATGGKNLILYEPNGSTPTFHKLLDSDCIGGTQILERPSFPEGKTVEGLTQRTVTMVVGGLRRLPGGSPTLKAFQEHLDFAPSGTEYGHLRPKFGIAVKQQLKTYGLYRVSQKGQAIGFDDYPKIPDPIWPAALKFTEPLKSPGSPRRIGSDYIEYPLSWEWMYESAYPLNGQPNKWGL